MRAKLHLVLSISIFFIVFSGWSQDKYWKPVASKAKVTAHTEVNKSSMFVLEEKLFQDKLGENLKTSSDKLIYFPDASGKLIGFTVEETPVFNIVLAKKYPNIVSYTGWSSDKKHKIRFSSSPKGIQGMLIDVTDDTKATFY